MLPGQCGIAAMIMTVVSQEIYFLASFNVRQE